MAHNHHKPSINQEDRPVAQRDMKTNKASPKRSKSPKSPKPTMAATISGVPLSETGPLLKASSSGYMFHVGDCVVYLGNYGAAEIVGTVPEGTDVKELYDVVDTIAGQRFNVHSRIVGGVRSVGEHGYVEADESGLRLSDLAHREIKRKTDEAVAAFIKKIPQEVDNLLREAMHTAIGIKKDAWRNCEIARDSVLAKVIERRSRARVEQMADSLLAESLDKLNLNQPLLDAAMKVAHHTYRDEVTKRVNGRAVERAEEDVAACLETLSMAGLKFDYQRVRDPANPADFKGPVGEILLEHYVEGVGDEHDE